MKARHWLGCGLATLILALTGCSGGGSNEPKDVLSGKITVGGKPAPSVQLVVISPDGKPGGGTANEKGEYLMPNPPHGMLRFQFMSPASLPKGSVLVPPKYSTPAAAVTFEYPGGKVTKDFDLAP